MSHMRTTMQTQPDELRRLLADRDPATGRGGADRRPAHVAGRHRDELARRPSRRVAAAARPGVEALARHAADVAPYVAALRRGTP